MPALCGALPEPTSCASASSATFPLYLCSISFLSAAVFLLFDRMIFGRLVEKHTLRILSYPEERQMFLRFFDGKSFAIMAGMMSGGILLRRIPAVPTQFIAVFYSGLGAALLLAGILFGVKFFTSSSHSSAA